MTPIGTKVIIAPEQPKSDSGIELINQSAIKKGTVLEVGPDVKQVKKNDTVIFSPLHYEEIEKEIFIIEERDIWVIV